MDKANATITLIGSGEFGEGMGRVYREILSRLSDEIHGVFLDTPAGFELNADAISSKAADYFSQRLGLNLQVASYKNKSRVSALESESALNILRRADFIFAGPGSPSYTIRNWQDTPLWETVLTRFERGAHLVFASAAAIAVGALSLPVYEIYKAGEDLHWLAGMNLFRALGMNLAIVPHWNNSEGGTYDTRFCYMGEERFAELVRLAPPGTVFLGIDEYTACLFDPGAQECRVMGAGSVTIHCDDQEWSYSSGAAFPFAQLRTGKRPGILSGSAIASGTASDPSDETTLYLMQLARALDEAREEDVKRDLIDRAHDTMHELSAQWLEAAHGGGQDPAPFVETFIEIRKQLRAAKQFALADEIRTRLAGLNIVLEDTNGGTTWRKLD